MGNVQGWERGFGWGQGIIIFTGLACNNEIYSKTHIFGEKKKNANDDQERKRRLTNWQKLNS